jgi:putative transposase
VDRGVVVAVATSAGELLDRAFVSAGERRRVLALQRKLSRAAKGSAKRNKTRAAMAEVRARERRRRQDFCQKTARQLAHSNAVVVLEKLQAKNMTRRAKPAPDPKNPGRYLPNGAAAKSGLNKAILSKGWYRFEQALNSVSRYTSNPAEHADVNAAKNILAAGLAVTACRESAAPAGTTETPKQEPAGNREELLLQPHHSAPAA